ncbi:MAG: tRNA (guanosine(46)-N7)-methyltransferase TrmB [Bacteroidia bacterium]|nr:tRNA (guanosine(46)-N7)-methyltransferase TrmB [Bacteroidia bacterium]MCZ2276509.1 tRNA (guanosine(46)-N7)-methyltransferase TrmB [Bacteroidia bacterium]
MGKYKLRRWEDLKTMLHVFQPEIDFYSPDNDLKGKWHEAIFRNRNPIVVEAGCGKGEYTVALAKKYPEKNFIGIDIKGARIWKGAKTVADEKISNAAFLRLRLELIEKIFSSNELTEIWLTFPDPQPRQSRENRRLTSRAMLSRFSNLLKSGGLLHLKTDSIELFNYTLETLKDQPGKLLFHTFDVDSEPAVPEDLSICTTYEKVFRSEGKKISYLCFRFEK